MIKTGNRIYKISVRNLTTNPSSSSFYSVFVSQCTFNSDPEAEHFHFLPRNPKRHPHQHPYTFQIGLWFIDIDRKYLCQKIYFSVFEQTRKLSFLTRQHQM